MRTIQPRHIPAQAARYRSAGYWRDETLTDIARRRVGEAPDRILVIEGASQLTRGDIWNRALRLAAFFRSRELRPGDVVSFQLPNWSESVVIALAARMMTLVINPIPPIYRESELHYILSDCGARLLFAPKEFRNQDYRALLAPLRARLPALRDVVEVRGDGNGQLDWNTALSCAPLSDDELPKVDPAAVMMVMYTSGTTGRPKGVLHTHYSYSYKVRQMGAAWDINTEDVIFMPSPVTHISGAFWSFDMPWQQGAATVLMDVWKPDEAIRTIKSNRCTVSGGATPFLQQLLNAAEQRPDAMDSLRTFFCGGSTVSPELIKKASAKFPHCLFFRAYGSTEMPTAAMGIRHREQALQGAETDGEIVPPVEIKLVDDDGRIITDEHEGEILARGPELCAGYLHEDDNRSSFDADGFFRMGDLGHYAYGHYLVITGRKKDLIIRAGENISPKEVEDLLLLHPSIEDIAIVAMPHPVNGEIGCAFIITKPGYSIDLADIQRHLSGAGLARQKFPEYLVITDDLPRVSSGKIRKDLLRARARELAAGVP